MSIYTYIYIYSPICPLYIYIYIYSPLSEQPPIYTPLTGLGQWHEQRRTTHSYSYNLSWSCTTSLASSCNWSCNQVYSHNKSCQCRDATHVWGKNRKTGNKYSCHQLPFPSYPNLFRPTSPQLSLIATNAITR